MRDRADGVGALEALERAARARELALFLDFDGTLSEIVVRPEDAVPVAASVEALSMLMSTDVWVAIVSGRRLDDLLGRVSLPGAWFAGQHGGELADPCGGYALLVDDAGARTALVSFAHHAREVAGPHGLLVEEKGLAVAVHYRGLAPDASVPVIAALRRVAAPALAADLAVWTEGKCVVELRARGADKGAALRHLRRRWAAPDYMVAIGDDTTDEDMFAACVALGGAAIKIGGGPSIATPRLDDPADLAEWLGQLAALRRLIREPGAPKG